MGHKAARGRPLRRALIVGGSMSGLFAAHLLRRRGWRVDVFERSAVELTGRGAGIVVQPGLHNVLDEAGLRVPSDLGVEVRTRRLFDREGRAVSEIVCPQTMTSWERLRRVLKGALPTECYHLGCELLRADVDGARVVARFSDGARIEGDLLVGADGIRSTVRSQFLPQAQPLYAGYVAWRGLVAESRLSQRSHGDVFAHLAFCLPPGEQMLGYPVPGPGDDLREGRRSYNFVWYRPAEEQSDLKRLLTDDFGRAHALSIPPPLISTAVLAELRASSERLLAPQFREVVALAPQPFLQPIYDLEVSRMAFGPVVLIGDAAFVARPHVAAGVIKAAEDAAALAEALDGTADVPAALASFEEVRLAVGRRIIQRARELGSYIRPARGRPDAASADERAVAERVLADTALMHFLRC
jgi:2-polyprenyl-6-methoxyphenol hydroxylase-like FAD-dependent oxidoreductase